MGGELDGARYVSSTDWLAVGEGLIGFLLGLVVGVLVVLVRVVTGSPRNGRHTRRDAGD
jgi:hypothetical protein